MIRFFHKLKKVGRMLVVPGNLVVLGVAILCGFAIYITAPAECVIIGCRDSVLKGEKYCNYHECNYFDCKQKRYGPNYCKEHSCDIANCENIAIENGRCKYHYDHICSKCIYNPDIPDHYGEKIECQRKYLSTKYEYNRCGFCHYKNCNREVSYSADTFCEDHQCAEYGCSRVMEPGSFYCSIHKSPPRENFFGEKKSSTNNYYYYGGGSSHSTSSYDSGYDDVYFDEDYDWDRYWSDPDYADGVDDALEDEGW